MAHIIVTTLMDSNNSKEIRGKMDKEIEDILNSILDKK
jgi:hypothetical protein